MQLHRSRISPVARWALPARWAATLSCALSLTACGGGSDTPSDSGITPSSTTGTATLDATGGTVQSSDQQLQVQAAPGALLGATTFSVSKIDQLDGVPDGYQAVTGSAYQVTWQGAGFASGAGVTLRIKSATGPTAQDIRITAQGLHVTDDPLSTSAVVHCADGSINVVPIDTHSTDGYGDARAILCDPVAVNGNPQSTSQVGVVQSVQPTITTPPSDASVVEGSTATFHVVANHGQGYQWLRNNVAISGATTDTYSLVASQGDNGAQFAVRVRNGPFSVTSASATLTVGPPPPPPAPQWQTPTDLSGYTTASDLPKVGAMVDVPLVAWNGNGILNSSDGGVQAMHLPTRSRPRVLAGPNLTKGYIVFIDDDGTSHCNAGYGNRLSAVAVGWSNDAGNFPPSDRFTLYQSTGDCIGTFSAAMGVDATQHAAIVFALQEQTAAQLKVGTAYADHSQATGNGGAGITWTSSSTGASALTNAAACTHVYVMSDDSMRGTLQAHLASGTLVSNATLTWVASDAGSFNVCAATYTSGAWSTGGVVFDSAQDAEPIVTMDAAGNTLIAASRVVDPHATPLAYAMTAAYRPAAGGDWQLQALDASSAPSLPSAAFDAAGNAFIVWRPATSGTSTVYQTRRDATGHWDTVQALSTPLLDTRYPRICVSDDGQAVALFEELSAAHTFRVVSRRWKNGLWSTASTVQDNANEGRYADCPGNTALANLWVVWRETHPTDATQFRMMSTRFVGS